MKTIHVRSASGSYEIVCGRGVRTQAAIALARLGRKGTVFLISSPRVWRRWGARIEKAFKGISKATILFDDREAAKNLSTVEHLCRRLVRAGADRRATLVAVGGGVVGDVAGFVAASYARGVGLVHVPTTLVAQVDSAIGGKTGVNLPEGKNLVGAFYPPRLVVSDSELLRTLRPREFRSGLYEVIKYGVIGDPGLFRFLEQGMGKLLRRDESALDFIIERAAKQKARVVSVDEHEDSLREILNFGHTFAHALETVTRYRRYLHGEAVGLGMIAAAHLAVSLRMFSGRDAKRLAKLVASVGRLPSWPNASPARMMTAMKFDKKTRGGRLRFVLPERIGKVRCGVDPDPRVVAQVLRDCASSLSGP